MDKKATIIIGVLIVLVLGAGFYFWNQQEDMMQTTDTETLDANGSIPETRDLEAEFNASSMNTNADMQGLEAEFEGSAPN